MDARQVKHTVKEWVETSIQDWPGICAAHLVAGITTMPDDAPFPPYKDVDLHLIFEENSPRLVPRGPFPDILEISYKDLIVEGGIKSIRAKSSRRCFIRSVWRPWSS